MISKELLSNVLNVKICIDDVKPHVQSNMLVYDVLNNNEINTSHINIYELAHKCKEWAFSLGCELSSFTNYSGSWFSTIKFVDVMARPISFNSNKEPEAIFKACEWLLDNKES